MVHGDEQVNIGGARQRRLLALLVARSNTVASLDWLAEHLWADSERPGDYVAALRTYVSRLRSSLPEEIRAWLGTTPSGYRLAAPTGSVDIQLVESLRGRARHARESNDPLVALDLLDRALAWWQGAPFIELEDVVEVRPTIERLELDHLETMEERWEVSLALGRHTQITGELAGYTAEHGLRERGVRQYALALHRSGRTADGLRAIAIHRSRLVDESGLEPSAALVELESALLAGDDSLLILQPGRPLRGYRLLEEIGEGAFAIVWRAEQPSVGRDVAIKQIRSELATQPDFIRRFEAEAHLVAGIEHPHIVPLIDFWRDPDSAYLVFRWLRGGTLERRLDDGPLPLAEALLLAQQIGSALSSAHRSGVVHRDVKPANILFDDEGNAFLSDFGIALEIAESNGPEAALSPGSLAYASPEQQRGEKLGPQADVYSFGVVLSECLDTRETPTAITAVIAQATALDPTERFATIVDFVQALHAEGDARATPSDVKPATHVVLAKNPYMGLRAFDQGDDEQFFGRERLVSELVERLGSKSLESRCVVLVGPSGSGKSSVVRAGLLPAIRRGEVRDSADWFVSTMVPGVDPFKSLEAALLRVAVDPPTRLFEQLRDGPRGILRGVRRSLGRDDATVLIAIDQFEELFLGSAAEHANEFLDALTVALRDAESPLRVAITIRADFYDRPLAHPQFASVIKACAVEVTPLAPDELEQAIVEPAAIAGVEFEPGLVSTISAAMAGQETALPLLQYTLSELFDQRDDATITTAMYHELGGISGALAARAESIYTSVSAEQRSAVRRVFGRLTDPLSISADVRRRAPLSEFKSDDAAQLVLEDFGAARLLTFDRDRKTREPTVEVAHEALLRAWPRLVDWLREDRELLRSIAAVSGAASQWDSGGREPSDLYRGWRLHNASELYRSSPERFLELDSLFVRTSETKAGKDAAIEARRVTRLRQLVGAITVALIVALIAGSFAVRQSGRASDAVQEAQSRANEAELATLLSRSAVQVDRAPDLGLLLALEAHRREPSAATEQGVLNALGAPALASRTAAFEPLNDAECGTSTLSRDGATEYGVADGQLVSRSTQTGMVIDHGPAPSPCVRWLGDTELNQRVAVAGNDGRVWLGPLDGPWQVERALDRPVVLASRELTPANRILLQTNDAGVDDLVLLDGSTGETVGEVPGAGLVQVEVVASSDGTIIAVSGFNGSAEGLHVTVVADGVLGRELARIETEDVLTSLAIDVDAGELVAASQGSRSIRTFDLATGLLRFTVQPASPTPLVDGGMAVQADGSLVIVTDSQIEMLDRQLGPIGSPTPVDGVERARLRSDGALVTIDGDGRVVLVDPRSSAIVSQVWEVEALGEVILGEGMAAVVGEPAGTAQLINLSTGQRSQTTLVDASGEVVIAVAGWPYDNGIWTVGEGGLHYWKDGVQRTSLPLGDIPFTGTTFGERSALFVSEQIGFEEIHLVDLEDARVVVSIPAPFSRTAHPTADGGVHVFYRDGRLQTFDETGVPSDQFRIEQLDTTLLEIAPRSVLGSPISLDPSSGRIATPGVRGEALLIDPNLATVDVLPGVEDVSAMSFARDGQLLVISQERGMVSLWDLERGQLAGQVSTGGGTASVGLPWYDEETDSVWIAGSTQLTQIPLDPTAWIERACEVVDRQLTQAEWDQFVPGDEPLQSGCR